MTIKNISKRLLSATILFITLISCNGAASTSQPPRQSSHRALPSIQVAAHYPGADVKTIVDAAASPLVDSIFQHVGNMDHMSYAASSDGSLVISIFFPQGANLDQPAVTVSNLVSVATGQLTAPSGITVLRKSAEVMLLAVDLYLEDTGHYDQFFLRNYAATNIVPELTPIPGVSSVTMLGAGNDRLIHTRLSKNRMAALHVTLKEVLAAIPPGTLEAVTGVLQKDSIDYIVKTRSKPGQLMAYKDMIVRTGADTVLRIKDVAAAAVFAPESLARTNGKPGISIMVMHPADSNDNNVKGTIEKLMETASRSFPTGMKYSISYNPEH